MPDNSNASEQVGSRSYTRHFWTVIGLFFVMVGTIGIVVPIMPTVIFYIIAAASFARGSERFEQRLLTDPNFGPTIIAWREHRAISRIGKIWAILSITGSFILTFWLELLPQWGLTLMGVFFLGLAVWLATRPEPGARLEKPR